MKTKRSATILPGVMLAAGCSIFPPDIKPPTDVRTVQRFEQFARRITSAGSPPGLSVAVVGRDRIHYQGHFGQSDGPRGQATTPETMFQWWSVTKLFTAAAILQLQEQGRLKLDDPVQKHLPFFRVTLNDRPVSDLRIRHLLSHSSGLPEIGMEIVRWVRTAQQPPVNQTAFLKQQLPRFNQLTHRPGSAARYSNLGYLVLAAVIEASSGQTYEQYIRSRILLPLGMRHTTFELTPELRPHAAAGSHPMDLLSCILHLYMDLDPIIREKKHGRYWFRPVYSLQKGATGLIGPASDLGRFLMALLNEGRLGKVRILTARSVQQMNQIQIKIKNPPMSGLGPTSFGMAWFVHKHGGRTIRSHGGNGPSFLAMVRMDLARGLGVVVLANSTYLGRSMGLKTAEVLGAIDWQSPRR